MGTIPWNVLIDAPQRMSPFRFWWAHDLSSSATLRTNLTFLPLKLERLSVFRQKAEQNFACVICYFFINMLTSNLPRGFCWMSDCDRDSWHLCVCYLLSLKPLWPSRPQTDWAKERRTVWRVFGGNRGGESDGCTVSWSRSRWESSHWHRGCMQGVIQNS